MSVPENFKTTVSDFLNDLSNTFPEYNEKWEKWKTPNDNNYEELFDYCVKVYPERFFDILYQNDIFKEESEVNTFFLPDVDFKILFNCEGVSEKTKQTIWKYIQLILFITVGKLKDKNNFGETANLFEGINEEDLEEKLKDTMSDISGFFDNLGVDLENMKSEMEKEIGEMEGENGEEGEKTEFNFKGDSGLPDMAGLHEHLKGLFDGKIGKLAKELAEEISSDFTNILGEQDDAKTTQDVLKNMMKNPKKMMNLIKTVSDKIKNKMDSGEISKDELMGEASELLSKMKAMGGGKQFNDILKKFAGGMGKNMRVDSSALNRMAKKESTRDRLLKKMEKNKNLKVQGDGNMSFSVADEEKQERSTMPPAHNDEELIAAFEDEKKEEAPKPKKKKKKVKK